MDLTRKLKFIPKRDIFIIQGIRLNSNYFYKKTAKNNQLCHFDNMYLNSGTKFIENKV